MALCYNFSRVLSILGFDRWLAVLAVRTRNPRGMLFLDADGVRAAWHVLRDRVNIVFA
jgi:hypothetical protein